MNSAQGEKAAVSVTASKSPGWRAQLANPRAVKGYLSLADQCVVSATTFSVNIFLARYLGVDEYGLFVVAYTVYLLIAAVQDAMFGYPALIVGARLGNESLGGYVSSLFVLQCIFGISVSALSIGAIAAAYSYSGAFDPWMLYSFVSFVLFALSNQFLRRLLYLYNRAFQVLLVDLLFSAFLFASLFYLASGGRLGFAQANYSLAFAAFGAFVAGTAFLGGRFVFKGLSLRASAVENLRFGKWLVAQNLCTWGTGQIYYLVSAAVLGMKAPAVLKVCANLLAPLQVIFQGIDSVLVIAISKRLEAGTARPFLLKAGAAIVAFSLIYSLIIPVFSDDLISILYGPSYGDLLPIVVIFAVAFVFRSVAVVPNLALLSIKATRETFFVHLTTLFITLASIYPLLHYGEIIGAAVGTVLIPYFFWAVLMLWRVSKLLPKYNSRVDAFR